MLPDLRMVNNEDADDIVDKHYDDDENNNDDDNNCNNADSGISIMENNSESGKLCLYSQLHMWH